ncbi:hypothetical protein FOCC_FOCC005974, partial [Frankliniella occidentalis]
MEHPLAETPVTLSAPAAAPTTTPTALPTASPTASPTATPAPTPTATASIAPSTTPATVASSTQSMVPSTTHSIVPSSTPAAAPQQPPALARLPGVPLPAASPTGTLRPDAAAPRTLPGGLLSLGGAAPRAPPIKRPRLTAQMSTEVTDSLGRKLCLLPSLPRLKTLSGSTASGGILSRALSGGLAVASRTTFVTGTATSAAVTTATTTCASRGVSMPVGILARTLSAPADLQPTSTSQEERPVAPGVATLSTAKAALPPLSSVIASLPSYSAPPVSLVLTRINTLSAAPTSTQAVSAVTSCAFSAAVRPTALLTTVTTASVVLPATSSTSPAVRHASPLGAVNSTTTTSLVCTVTSQSICSAPSQTILMNPILSKALSPSGLVPTFVSKSLDVAPVSTAKLTTTPTATRIPADTKECSGQVDQSSIATSTTTDALSAEGGASNAAVCLLPGEAPRLRSVNSTSTSNTSSPPPASASSPASPLALQPSAPPEDDTASKTGLSDSCASSSSLSTATSPPLGLGLDSLAAPEQASVAPLFAESPDDLIDVADALNALGAGDDDA